MKSCRKEIWFNVPARRAFWAASWALWPMPAPVLTQVTDPAIFSAVGIPLKELDIIVLKSRVHFRRGFVLTRIAGSVVIIDAPGWGSADLSTLPYKNIPKNLYPLNKEIGKK
jgi:microcystin degradation protein MlrC